MNKHKYLLFLGQLFIVGCGDTISMPKPKGWPRISLPEHKYKEFSSQACPFSFELPSTAIIDSMIGDSCRLNFYFPELNCRWHVTYRHIPSSGKSRSKHFEEYHSLTYKHIQKSTRINDVPVHTEYGSGILYELYGSIGVPAQFIFGDSSNLVMTSFYFPTAVDGDSLAPVINFVKEDMRHMIETLRWK